MITGSEVAATKPGSDEWTTTYAIGADFCGIFTQDMNDLCRLAFLLTADPARAEQCFVSGLADCSAGNHVFKEWARSWARRAIIRNAVRLVAPRPVSANGLSDHRVSEYVPSEAGDQARLTLPEEMSAVLDLPTFERFIFVMSVLEGYSDQDCALLIGCTRKTMVAARVRAMQQIGRPAEVHGAQPAGAAPQAEGSHNGNSIVEIAIPERLATPA